ncbi:MAG: VOC family protein [Candidatus Competibacteraceae bacterium]|nr:VOC family protein [Candidatus Competibacteraceae bacterium]MCP5134152.1 VOC family protein [Gammaproteobacteria bacterium]
MNENLMKHGAFSWSELITPDVNAARSFYSGLFGWTFEDFLGAGAPYTLVKADGDMIGGIMAPSPECAGMPPAWGVYVTVDDVDATARQVEMLGGKLLRPPEDIPEVGRFCVLQDPQGATLCAITYRQP